MRKHRAGSLITVALGTALALSACGTTVPNAGAGAAASQDGLGATDSGAGQPQTSGVQTGSSQTTGSTSSTGGSSSSGAVTGSAAAATGAASGNASGTAPVGGGSVGGSKAPVTVGVITSGDAASAFAAVGFNAQFGSQRGQAEAVAKYLNARGGVGGHQIKLTYYDYSAGSSTGANAQAACAAFADDNHAFAAIGVAGMDDAFHACAAKHRMLVLSDGDLKSSSFLRKYPTTIEISDVALDRKYRGMVLGLKDQGFFTSGAKVGLLYIDEPNDVEGVKNGMKPALRSIGITSTTDIAVSTDTSQQTSQTASAVLKFRAAGVTHILFGRASAFLFDQDAQSQSYFPKMGIESRQSPALLMQGSDNPQQLANTMGIGYQPLQDVDAAHDPGPVSSNQALCKKILDAAGQGWGTSRLTEAAALYICDQLFFLRDVMSRASTLSPDAFLGSVAGLGAGYRSTMTFATSFSASQHDGAQSYRPLKYDTGCSCFVYAGPLRRLP